LHRRLTSRVDTLPTVFTAEQLVDEDDVDDDVMIKALGECRPLRR